MADFSAYSQNTATVLGYLAEPVRISGDYAHFKVVCEKSVFTTHGYETARVTLPLTAKRNLRRGRGGVTEPDKKFDGLGKMLAHTPMWFDVEIITDKDGKPFLKVNKYGRAYCSPPKDSGEATVSASADDGGSTGGDDEAPF